VAEVASSPLLRRLRHSRNHCSAPLNSSSDTLSPLVCCADVPVLPPCCWPPYAANSQFPELETSPLRQHQHETTMVHASATAVFKSFNMNNKTEPQNKL
jgi:hypothetical protein